MPRVSRRLLFLMVPCLAVLCLALPPAVAAAPEDALPPPSGEPAQNAPAPAHSGETERYSSVSDDDAVIVEVTLAGHKLGDVMMAYYQGDRLLLPLNGLMSRLQFPIEVNIREGAARGWFIKEDRTFSLSARELRADAGGAMHNLTTRQIIVETDDIYVDARVLEQWFPLNFAFNDRRQIVEIQPREPLPIEAALMREQRAPVKGGEYQRPQYARAEEPYKLFSPPSADVTYRTAYDNSSSRKWENDLSVLAAGDALYMNQMTFASFDEESGVVDLRTRLERRDIDGELLGPLHARDVAVGDVYSPAVDLVAQSTDGRGVFLSNFSDQYLAETDRITVRGDLQPGWDVELYRNDMLLDFQRVGENGQYEFIDMPLLVGFNVFRLVFYGPFGERREEIRRYVNDPTQRDAGKLYYRFSATQHQRDVIPVGSDDAINTPNQGAERFSSEFSYGVADNVSLESNVASIPLEDGTRENYVSGGVRSSFFGVLADTQLTRALSSGTQAGLLSLQTNLGGFNLALAHSEFLDGFKSEQADSVADPYTRHSQARLDGALGLGLSRPVGFGLNAEYQEHESGRVVTKLGHRLSSYVAGAYASHTLRYQEDEGSPGLSGLQEFEGDLLLSFRPWEKWTVRGQQIYDISPETDLESTALTAEYMVHEDMNFRSGITKNFENEGATSISVGLNKYFKRALAGIDSRFSDEGEIEVGLSLSFSLGRNPHTGEWQSSYKEMASGGMVAPRVYLDHNQNHVFDEGDEPMENVAFRAERLAYDEKTGMDGSTLLPRIPAHQPVNIELEEKSLEDPYLLPTEKGKEVVARPGTPVILEFPVAMTGEIDGTVYVQTPEGTVEASSVDLELVKPDGALYAKRTSSYDGFFLFEMVPLGAYTLRVSPEQMQRLGYRAVLAEEITLNRETQSSLGHHIVLEPEIKTDGAKTL